MSQRLFATRLPESMYKYIKYKALHTGKSHQELMSEIIAQYQQNDSEFMELFAGLMQAEEEKEGVSHGA